MATAIAPKLENPNNGSDLNSTPPAAGEALSKPNPPSSGDESKVESAEAEAEKVAEVTTESGAVTDIQKKMKRAERFGMTVQMTENEKRSSRAERFGTSPAAPNGSEEVKKKARAERFGITQSEPSDEEAKKKARLARFSSVSKTDSVEEDKKKARAIRFSQPDSVSKTNGKENIEVKTENAGKAGGGT